MEILTRMDTRSWKLTWQETDGRRRCLDGHLDPAKTSPLTSLLRQSVGGRSHERELIKKAPAHRGCRANAALLQESPGKSGTLTRSTPSLFRTIERAVSFQTEALCVSSTRNSLYALTIIMSLMQPWNVCTVHRSVQERNTCNTWPHERPRIDRQRESRAPAVRG